MLEDLLMLAEINELLVPENAICDSSKARWILRGVRKKRGRQRVIVDICRRLNSHEHAGI